MRVKTTFSHNQYEAISWGRDVADLLGSKPRRPWDRWRGVVVGQGISPEAAVENACKAVRTLRNHRERQRQEEALRAQVKHFESDFRELAEGDRDAT